MLNKRQRETERDEVLIDSLIDELEEEASLADDMEDLEVIGVEYERLERACKEEDYFIIEKEQNFINNFIGRL